MLQLTVATPEFYDEESQEFVPSRETTLKLEHSLFSLSKWESIHEKPFLDDSNRTQEETKSYIRCMLRGKVGQESFIDYLSDDHYRQINTYIDKKHSATWFSEKQTAKSSGEKITSELLYYWMISFNIPMKCEHWHLNRLLTLIRVFNVKQSKPKKQTAAEIAKQRRELNAQRLAASGSKG